MKIVAAQPRAANGFESPGAECQAQHRPTALWCNGGGDALESAPCSLAARAHCARIHRPPQHHSATVGVHLALLLSCEDRATPPHRDVKEHAALGEPMSSTKVKLRNGISSGLSHDNRMKTATMIADGVRQKHGNAIAAIGIYGSTAVSCDLPYSDLDMTIVTYEDLDAETKCYSYCGIPVQLDYQTVQDSMEQESSVPGEGGCWDSFLVLYDPDNVVGKLRERYRALTDPDYATEFRKRMSDGILTYIGKVRNAVLRADRSHLVGSAYQFGVEVCRAVGVLNRAYVTGATNLVESTKAMRLVPRGFRTLIDLAIGNTAASDQQIYDACEDLWEGMMALAKENSMDCDLENSAIRY